MTLINSLLERTDKNILLIIGLLFVVRLTHITDPPIEVSHNWRQTTSLMVARNFYQHDGNIMYPTLDEMGERDGVVAMEFPALPYAISVVSQIFGYEHWYGRLINLAVVSVGLWYFYLLVGLYFEKKIAFYSTLAFAFSALFHLARKVLPDPMAQSLVIIGVYYGTQFLRRGGGLNLLLYFLLATLGALVKIPFGSYLAVLAFPFFSADTTAPRRTVFGFISVFVIGTVFWWYFVWNMHLAETYGQWYNSGRSIVEGIKELGQHFGDVLAKFYFNAFHSFIYFVLTLGGLGIAIYHKNKKILYLLLLLLPVFAVYMFKSGFLFAHHGYYALVLVPVMAILVGYLIGHLPRRWAVVVLLVATAESVANQQHDFFIKDREYTKLQLAEISAATSGSDDLVALVSNDNPNEFYFLNRKGWLVSPEHLNEPFLDSLAGLGCTKLYMRKGKYEQSLSYEKVFENQDYLVFSLFHE